MAELLKRAKQLTLARNFVKEYPDRHNQVYVTRVQRLYDEAYQNYTDPFGTKTYA